MKAITTKFAGPTDRRGSRIIASDGDGNRLTMSYHHEWNGDENHHRAALAPQNKLGWSGKLISGQQKPGVHVHVFTD